WGAVEHVVPALHQRLQPLYQQRAVAAPPRQRQLLAQAPVARRQVRVVEPGAAPGRVAAAGVAAAAALEPGLEGLPLGLVAGDERVLPHVVRPSSQRAMPNRRCNPASPVAPVNGAAMAASSSRRPGVRLGARSASPSTAACSAGSRGAAGTVAAPRERGS